MPSSRWCRCSRSAAITAMPAPGPADDRHHQVRVRDEEDRGRHQQRQQRGEPVQVAWRVRVVDQQRRVEGVGARYRPVGEQQAEQHGADVAHEDPGRVEVVRQEPDAHAGQQRRGDRRQGQRRVWRVLSSV